MNAKQTKALECLNEIEQYAKEQKLSTRILDGIDECKDQIAVENVNWNEVNLAVEDLLKSIEQKMTPVSAGKETNKNEVSIQEIKAQVTEMAKRWHVENEESANMMTERKKVVLEKTYREIQEISYSRAHRKELKDEELYLEFFKKVKGKYETEIFSLIKEMISDISGNCTFMLERMRSMFQSIGGYAKGVGNQKFYYEYTGRKEGLDKKIQGEIETTEAGGGEIISFANRTKEAVKEIKNKVNRKTKLLMIAPVLVVLGVLLIGFSVKTITAISENRAAMEEEGGEKLEEKSEPKTNDNSAEENDEIKGMVNFIMEEAVDTALSKAESEIVPNVAGSLFKKILIVVILIVIVLYIIYIAILKLWCDQQVRKRCGEYLKTETVQFEHDNVLMPKLEDAIKTAVEEYESQYLAILNSIFMGTDYDSEISQSKKSDQFAVLKEKWNAVRYE